MNDQHYEKEFTFTSAANNESTGEEEIEEEKVRTIPVETPERERVAQTGWTGKQGGMTGLLDSGDAERLRARWNEIQAKFVDEPRASVSDADELVSETIQHILQRFHDEISSLEHQWKQGDEISTEDLRQVLQHYRSFFNNLVV